MSGYVIKIPQEKENRTIWSRQLSIAGSALLTRNNSKVWKTKSSTLRNTSKEIPFGDLSLCM